MRSNSSSTKEKHLNSFNQCNVTPLAQMSETNLILSEASNKYIQSSPSKVLTNSLMISERINNTFEESCALINIYSHFSTQGSFSPIKKAKNCMQDSPRGVPLNIMTLTLQKENSEEGSCSTCLKSAKAKPRIQTKYYRLFSPDELWSVMSPQKPVSASDEIKRSCKVLVLMIKHKKNDGVFERVKWIHQRFESYNAMNLDMLADLSFLYGYFHCWNEVKMLLEQIMNRSKKEHMDVETKQRFNCVDIRFHNKALTNNGVTPIDQQSAESLSEKIREAFMSIKEDFKNVDASICEDKAYYMALLYKLRAGFHKAQGRLTQALSDSGEALSLRLKFNLPQLVNSYSQITDIIIRLYKKNRKEKLKRLACNYIELGLLLAEKLAKEKGNYYQLVKLYKQRALYAEAINDKEMLGESLNLAIEGLQKDKSFFCWGQLYKELLDWHARVTTN